MSGTALRRTLTPIQLAAIGMGTTIGVGWIVVTGSWIVSAGPFGASLAFIVGGAVMGLVALCYAEAAACAPEANGEYGYVALTFGRGWAFVVGWAALLGYIGICGFEGLALAWLLGVLAPEFSGPTVYMSFGVPVRTLDLAVIISGALFFTAINFFGAHESARVQVAVTIGKVVLSLGFVLIGFWGGTASNLQPVLEPVAAPWLGISAVLVMVPAWFCGFNALPQALGEARERPQAKVLARLLGSVILLTTVFYVAVILATAFAAPRSVLVDADLPVVTAIESVAGPWGGRIVLITGIVALLSAWNAAMFAASRLLYTLAQDGALPAVLSRVHAKNGTPSNAVMFVGFVALCGGLVGRSFIEPLVQIGAMGFAIAFIGACISSLALKRRQAHAKRMLPVLAATLGSAALAAVVGWSLYTIVAGSEGGTAEAAALTLWVILGAVMWVIARRNDGYKGSRT